MSYRTLAARYGLSYGGVRRHEHNHLNLSWELSKGIQAMLSGDNLLEMLGKWHERMEQQYANADASANIMGAVATARTGISAIESYARITVETELQREVDELRALLEAPQTGVTTED
jgi:hypothetical protein